MASNALAVVSTRDMTPMEAHAAYMEEKRDLILRTVCDEQTTPAELEFFLETCKTRGLNPLAKHIYFIRRKGRPTFQTSIDGYRLIASRTHQYAGSDAYEYDTESDKHPNRASCTVYRMVQGQRCAFAASVRWNEYEATKAATNGKWPTKWDDMPYQMLGKCAESAALRKAFPEELGGLYTEEEMDQADRPQTEPRTIGPPSTPITQARVAPLSAPRVKATAQPNGEEEVKVRLIAAAAEKGITLDADMTPRGMQYQIDAALVAAFGEDGPKVRHTADGRVTASALFNALTALPARTVDMETGDAAQRAPGEEEPVLTDEQMKVEIAQGSFSTGQ